MDTSNHTAESVIFAVPNVDNINAQNWYFKEEKSNAIMATSFLNGMVTIMLGLALAAILGANGMIPSIAVLIGTIVGMLLYVFATIFIRRSLSKRYDKVLQGQKNDLAKILASAEDAGWKLVGPSYMGADARDYFLAHRRGRFVNSEGTEYIVGDLNVTEQEIFFKFVLSDKEASMKNKEITKMERAERIIADWEDKHGRFTNDGEWEAFKQGIIAGQG